MSKRARIVGTGSYLPEKILTNEDLEKIVDTTDEWIFSRTGMKERRIAAEDEFTSQMGAKAANVALEKAGIKAEDVGLILFATLTPDYIFPSTAALVQSAIGAVNAAAFDMQAACSGYIYALSMAKSYIESGMYDNILIVASEKLSAITDYTDRGTCVLFGDGAAACIVSSKGKGLSIDKVVLGCDGDQAMILHQPAGGVRKPPSAETIENKEHTIRMEGREVFKHAVRRMESAAEQCLEALKLGKEKISWFIPHQANIRIIETIAKRFEITMEKVYVTVHKYGNTSASSVGIALDELMNKGTVQHDDHLLLVAFGAGLTWGACVLTMEEK
ncbi:MAG: ketoacyl-ACP synthase III [Simkaniaceae bacterium]|nr:ketoacyl-ACP synthase III [Simkaniaceae bacterium]